MNMNNMKSILLLEPNQIFSIKKSPPLGLLTVHEFIKSKGIDSTYINLFDALERVYYSTKELNPLKPREIAQIVFSVLKKDIAKHGIIGLSVTHGESSKFVLALCRIIKNCFPEKKIIIGGKHTTLFYMQEGLTISHFEKYFDFAVIFDGEISLYLLLKQNFQMLDNIPNLVFIKDGKINVNEIRNEINLNNLPLIRKAHDKKILDYETGRGCYWHKCTFCDLNYTKKPYNYREKSVKKIVSDLKRLKKETKNKTISFVNDAMPVKQALDLSNDIIKEKIKVSWATHVRFEKGFSFEILKKMKNAGCCKILGGLESGDQKINNEVMNKGIDLKDVERILRDCKNLGIRIVLFSVTGVPKETFFNALKTTKFFLRNKQNINAILFRPVSLYSYCDYYCNPKKYGILKFVKINRRFYFISWKGFFYRTFLMTPFIALNRLYFNKFTNIKMRTITVSPNFF